MGCKIGIVAAGIFLWQASARANELQTYVHQFTSSPPLARFEIVQSSLAALWTFRLDKFSGRVWQLVKTSEDDSTWEEMEVARLPPSQSDARPHFQIFTSGLAARHTFLIDNDNGKTWQLSTSKRKGKNGKQYEVHSWQPFVD